MTAKTTLFHPKGPAVEIELGGTSSPAELLGMVSLYLDAGWLVAAPGLEAGEKRDMIAYVVKGHVNDTVCLDLYREGDTFRFLGVYLNTEEQERAFEFASGIKVANMPEYVGQGHIERGKDKRLDSLVVRASKPFGVVWKENPRHDPNDEEKKKKPKRLFVRWQDQKTETVQEQSSHAKEWGDFLKGDPTLDQLNSKLSSLSKMPQEAKKQCWDLITKHADSAGLEFDKTSKQFVQPAPQKELPLEDAPF